MNKTTINGVDYRDFPYMEQIENNIREIVEYLNSVKKDTGLKIVIQSNQPDTSIHQMD
jgi:hypothetical protein